MKPPYTNEEIESLRQFLSKRRDASLEMQRFYESTGQNPGLDVIERLVATIDGLKSHRTAAQFKVLSLALDEMAHHAYCQGRLRERGEEALAQGEMAMLEVPRAKILDFLRKATAS